MHLGRLRKAWQCLLVLWCAMPAAQAGTRLALWGDNSFGQTDIPDGATNIALVAVGARHVVVVRDDGAVLNWGDNGFNQLMMPAGLSNVMALTTGCYQTLALRSNGTVVAWGDDTYGVSTVPDGLTNVAAISAGSSRDLALQSDGTLVSWGFPNGLPSGLTGLVAIAHQTLAVQADGAVIQWGFNSGDTTNTVTGPPANLADATAITAGQSHYVGLNVDGSVIAWGYNYAGQLDVPLSLSNVVAIAAGATHTLALRSDGTVVAWGENYYGESDVPIGLSNVIAIAAGGYTSAALVGDGPPSITLQPFGRSVLAGALVQLHARAAGIPPLDYQWQKGGTNIPGATQASLFLTNVTRTDSGSYRSNVKGPAGEATTSPAELVVRARQRLSTGQILPDGSFTAISSDADGAPITETNTFRFEAQASSNLVDWTSLPNSLSLTNGSLLLLDPSALNQPNRFYRIIEH